MAAPQTAIPDTEPSNSAVDLELEIARSEAELQRRRKRNKTLNLTLGGFIFLVGLLAWVIPQSVIDRFHLTRLQFMGLGIAYFVFSWLYLLIVQQSSAGRHETELEVLRAKRRIREQLSPPSPHRETTYFDSLVNINVENLAGYYSLVKVHTNKSFMVALAMGIAGFTLLAMGLILGFSKSERSDLMTYISTGAGVITEFIAAVFFYLYNRTVRQMKGYHDSLLSVQNVLLALKLVGETQNAGDRTKMVGQMLAYLLVRRAATVNTDKQEEQLSNVDNGIVPDFEQFTSQITSKPSRKPSRRPAQGS